MTAVRLCAAFLFATLAMPAAAAPLHAVCILERPMLGYGEQVVVTALTNAPAGTSLTITWAADGGVLSAGGAPASAVWTPASPEPAVFTIQARVVGEGEAADCTTRIAVTDRLTRGGNETLHSTRSLLAPDAEEAPGYGAYSYLLFAAPQTDADRDLIAAVLNAYFALSDTTAAEKRFPDIFTRPKLNITYVPITQPLPDDFDQRDDRLAWIRNNYDYDRAFAFLARLRTLTGDDAALRGGTFWIVSCQHPLSGKLDPRPVIPQNRSAVPVRLIPAVMRRFADLTSQPRDYNSHAFGSLLLDLRIGIGQIADELQPMMAALTLLSGGPGKE